MLLSLMINEFVLPIEPIFTISITTRMETMKDTLTSEMFLEMAHEITVASESLGASLVSTDEAVVNQPLADRYLTWNPRIIIEGVKASR